MDACDTSLPRANPGKSGDAEPRDYRDDEVAMSAEPPAMLTKVARLRVLPDASSRLIVRRGMGVLVVVSAAYFGVMAAVFTKGVQQATRTHRQAQTEE